MLAWFSRFKLQLEGSKTFHIRHSGKVGCFYISNVVSTNVDKFGKYQAHGGTNHLLCAKKTKTRWKNVFSDIKLF